MNIVEKKQAIYYFECSDIYIDWIDSNFKSFLLFVASNLHDSYKSSAKFAISFVISSSCT